MFTPEEYALRLERLEKARRCLGKLDDKTKLSILRECAEKHLRPDFVFTFFPFQDCVADKIITLCKE